MKKLTVVTVTFNALQAFTATLASVRGQTFRNHIEYLVVDGVSTDGTVDAIQQAFNNEEVDAWVSEPDQGIYDAMNKAVTLATGEYLLFLNAGDLFPAHETMERFWENVTGEPGFVWGDTVIEKRGQLIPDPASQMVRFLYRQMTVSHQSLAVRVDLLKSHPFDLSLKVAADYEVLCWLVKGGSPGIYRNVEVSRTQDEGFSSKHFFLGLKEKREVSRRYYPGDWWRSKPYFVLWGLYMRLKILIRAVMAQLGTKREIA